MQTVGCNIFLDHFNHMDNNFIKTVKEKSSEELLSMVYAFDEWSSDMLRAVENELADRNILAEDVSIRKQELIDKDTARLEQGKAASLAGQIFGWLGVLGLIGLIIGYNYTFSKTKSKYTGKKYYTYDEPSRDNGSYIFYISISVFV